MIVLTTEEVAAQLNVKPATVRRYIRDHDLEARKGSDGRWYFLQVTVDAFKEKFWPKEERNNE